LAEIERDTIMHKRVLAVALFALAACTGSRARADWGCAFDSNAGIGRIWHSPSEKEAREVTMNACTSRKLGGCRLIGCSNNVDSKEDADRLWPLKPGVTNTPCGHPGEPKC